MRSGNTLLERAKATLAEEDYEKLKLLRDAYLTLTELIERRPNDAPEASGDALRAKHREYE